MMGSTWGLALDGARARVVRDLGKDAPGISIPEELGLEVQPRRPGKMMSDRQYRGDRSVGASGDASGYASDVLLEAEREFCEEVLWLLGSHHRRGDFDQLVVAAEPRMLSVFRDRRNRDIAAAILAEIPKDYLHLSQADLRARLRELVPHHPG